MSFFLTKSRHIFTIYSLFLVASAILFICVRLRHLNIPLERDEGEYAYAAQEILRGRLPYTDFYNMKMPGVYYTMAFLFRLFGDSCYCIKFSLMGINGISAFFIYLTAKKLFGKDTAFASSAIFLLFCLSFNAQGWTANAEHFVVMFGCAGLFVTVLARENRSQLYWFLAGVLMMLAMICKQHGICYPIFPVAWWIVQWIRDMGHRKKDAAEIKRNENNNTETNDAAISAGQYPVTDRQRLSFIGCYFAGCGVPFFAMLLYFWYNGTLQNFYFLTFQYAAAYTELKPLYTEVWRFRPVFWDAFGFWFLLFVMIYSDIRKKIHIGQAGFFPILLILSFVSVSIGFYYRPHYFQLMFPVSAMMSAWILVRLPFRWRWITPARYIVFSFLGMCVMQYRYFFLDSSEQVTQNMYGTQFFYEKKIIGTYLGTTATDPKEKILVFGCEPQIFFYAHRESANGFLYMFPLLENHRFATSMLHKFIRETETSKPEVLVYFPDTKELSVNEKNLDYLRNWFSAFSKNYFITAQWYIKDGKKYSDTHSENRMYVAHDSTIALIYRKKQ